MAVTQNAPFTIHLGGPGTNVNDLATSETVTPGHLLCRFNNGGVIRVKKHATAAGSGPRLVVREQSMMNRGIADNYAASDLVEAVALGLGGSALMWIASGQNIVAGAMMESAGDGTLRVLAAGVPLFTALENSGAVTVLTRIRVEAV